MLEVLLMYNIVYLQILFSSGVAYLGFLQPKLELECSEPAGQHPPASCARTAVTLLAAVAVSCYSCGSQYLSINR